MSTDSKTSILFIFYNGPYDTPDKTINFQVLELPDNWTHIATYPIPPCDEIVTKYTNYTYYKGPCETIEEVKKSLDRNIREMSVCGSYHIQNTFLPIPV
jgi:hypothetical protein